MAALQQPFASRPLAPLLVRGLAAGAHVSLESGFLALAWGSLLVTLATIFLLATRTAAPRWILLAIAAVPFWPQLLHAAPLPDPPYAALLCGLLWCLAKERPTLAALTLFPLMVARESTMLVTLCLLLVAWRPLRASGCAVAVAATVAGSVLVKHLTAGAAGNVEHLPAFVYLMAKLPWNLLRTLGVDPWSNLYPYLCDPPVWQVGVHVGSLRAVGVCRTSTMAPSLALSALLTTFGVLPLVLLAIPRRGVLGGTGLLVRFCLLYGGISFALAPTLGTVYSRLYGYSWPLWAVALPAITPALWLSRQRAWRGLGLVLLLFVQVLLARLAFGFPKPWVLAAEVGLQAGAGAALWRWRRALPNGRPAGEKASPAW